MEAVVDLVAELVASELDAARRVKLGHQNSNPLRSEVLSYTAKIFDTKFLTESENSMNQDEIHDWRILAPSAPGGLNCQTAMLSPGHTPRFDPRVIWGAPSTDGLGLYDSNFRTPDMGVRRGEFVGFAATGT